MRSLKIALILVLPLLAQPALAVTELSLPLDYQSLVYTDRSTGIQYNAQGLGIPLLWFSGAGKHLDLNTGVGYANLTASGASGHYGTAETDLVFHFDFGPLTPRFGLHNSIWAPIRPLPGLDPWLIGIAPTLGLGVDLGFALLEAQVSQGPIWGVESQWPYRADLTRVAGRVTFGF